MLAPYPTELPTADAWALVKLLIAGGQPSPDPHALHVAWDCMGYALGRFDPDPVVLAKNKANTMDPIAAIDALSHGQKMGIADWPWLKIAQVIMQTLLQILAQYGS